MLPYFIYAWELGLRHSRILGNQEEATVVFCLPRQTSTTQKAGGDNPHLSVRTCLILKNGMKEENIFNK
jgi:hypothetical protein